ncbi:MAG TPA: F0F1 ATP synthase subunit delta [Thiothrix sp.]|nr:F0F1 ATP synthase subunit delta [Thiothrix sp.]
MSELTTTARPYARAVFELASESKTLTEWSTTLAFMAAIAANDDVRAVLDNPKLTRQDAADVFIELCDKKLDDKAVNLVKQLAENGRLSLLPEIASLYEALKDEAEGAIEAHVTSARKLTKKEQEAIAKALKKRLGRRVKITTKIDKSILGGAIIRAGDLVIDGSIQGRLRSMTQALSG